METAQADYRAVLTMRDRLARGEFGADRFSGYGDEAFKRAVREEFGVDGLTGADEDTVEVFDVQEVPLSYLPGNAVRIKVKAAGQLDR